MRAYIVNADKQWFEFLLAHRIAEPVFWFKRDRNPSPRDLAEGNPVFLRVTETGPPLSSVALGVSARQAQYCCPKPSRHTGTG